MRSKLFRSTSIRLASIYLVVVMAVSALFSISLYRVLGNEIDRNYSRSADFAERFVGFGMNPMQRTLFLRERLEDHDIGKRRLVNELLLINLSILVLGGGFCYVLARRTLKPIEESHEALERFTSDASHELRTPLATMRAEIEVALMNKQLSATQTKSLLESNLEEVERLTHLSERLLLLARIDEQELPRAKVLVGEVVARAVNAVTTRADQKNITVVSKLSSKDDSAIMGDETSLVELLVILLDNAIKYSEAGTKVKINSDKHAKKMHISVIDSGIGIDEEHIAHIFDRFYRADTSRTSGERHGYGLGLALAQKIAHIHDGTIEVKSKPGKGSTFTFVAPAASH